MPKTYNKTYIKNERAIWRELDKALETRRIDLKITEVCAEAQISETTFYAHHTNLGSALEEYETTLKNYFMAELITKGQREVVYVVLLSFIRRYRHYFHSTFKTRNMHLLTDIFMQLKPVLAGQEADTRQYIIYIASAQAMIAYWGIYEKFSRETMKYYTKRLSQMRVMNCGAVVSE